MKNGCKFTFQNYFFFKHYWTLNNIYPLWKNHPMWDFQKNGDWIIILLPSFVHIQLYKVKSLSHLKFVSNTFALLNAKWLFGIFCYACELKKSWPFVMYHQISWLTELNHILESGKVTTQPTVLNKMQQSTFFA